MTLKWTKWTDSEIKAIHGSIKKYRMLYDGDHSQLFERAKRLIEQGEITDQIFEGNTVAKQIQSPYIVANVSKMIVDVPAMLVSRAIGKVSTSTSLEDFEGTDIVDTDAEEDFIDPLEKQKEIIEGIAKRSKLSFEHKTNITHHQMDGGIVGVPYESENGIQIDFKSRDVYYPHDDGQGCDLVYELHFDPYDDFMNEGLAENYLHVYRERVEDRELTTKHMLYEIGEHGKLQEVGQANIYDDDDPETVAEKNGNAEQIIKDILGIDEVERTFPGRDKEFVVYWPNNKTFTNPLGRSALHNQENKQDEINWSLTRNGIVYERNGKPRIAVSKEIFTALQEKAFDRYGDESKIDHRDLEVTTFDENGKALEVIQIDVTKIGDIKWVKDIMKIMMMETQTSEKAVDFYMEGGSSAQTGIAKFYDLFTSILKAEQISDEYIHFLQQLFENCLWIANQDDPGVIIEEPKVDIKNMMPIARKELIDQESTGLKNGTQSLETAVRNQNPNASDDWIQDEIERIEEGQESQSSGNILQGRQTLNNMLDNRNPNGTPQGGDGE